MLILLAYKVVNSLSSFFKVLIKFKKILSLNQVMAEVLEEFFIKQSNEKYFFKKIFLKSYFESTERKVIVEEFLDGPQISTEGFFYKKNIILLLMLIEIIQIFQKQNHIYWKMEAQCLQKIENKTKKEIDKLIRKACNSINIKWNN